MRNYRFKRQTSKFGLFVGITARALHAQSLPGGADQISQRVWLDTSQVKDGFRDDPLPVTEQETESLRSGLRRVADDIEAIERGGHVVIRVEALEIVLADYSEATLAPAIAGWAAEQFGFTPYRIRVSLDEASRQYVFEWTR